MATAGRSAESRASDPEKAQTSTHPQQAGDAMILANDRPRTIAEKQIACVLEATI